MIDKRFLAAITLVVLSGCSSVVGVVRDKNTSTPVSSATVTVIRTSTTTTTDAVGHYMLSGMFISGDTIMINAPGYNIYTGTLKSGAGKEFIDVDLVPKNK
ncbi:carboxypeptidase regulatory-like domain-containing protein [Photobacterium proteolyticum]|uniref:carboxypeptidase regulatory-like domain-containing protein n=1 Tax=Photobacterium proteolyticum TaxID=1903952 RepID=UPI0009524E84|nr:carboxypeptidase regulatory-like domain-containing protein [Photobacterium proteolyticum]